MFNKLKRYNELLQLDAFTPNERNKSLAGIFIRDFIDNAIYFRGKLVEPTPKNGKDIMDTLFTHLTTKTENEDESHREYDRDRSIRIHWIRHHIFETSPQKTDIFSVKDKSGIRTYILDKDESYVIILEPRKSNQSYYLITAYYLKGGNIKKIENKGKRRLPEIV